VSAALLTHIEPSPPAGADYIVSNHGGSYLGGGSGKDALVSSNSIGGDEIHGGGGKDTFFNVGQYDKVYGSEYVFAGGTVYFTVNVMAEIE
jgi:Ca2+-binding RTX toxin-like protein